MSNSPLVQYTKISPNRTSPRTHSIDTVTIHCVVGQCSVETLGSIFAPESRQASANYGVGPDGRIGMYVEEKDRSWCSSNAANDHRAVTIEVASDTTEPYAVRDSAYEALIKLVADICKRNGIGRLIWSTDKNVRVHHLNGCNMTVHRDYANKSCPGTYLYTHMGDIAQRVNALLGVAPQTQTQPAQQIYRVRRSWTDAASQKGAFHSLKNAMACADANPGTTVFDEAGKPVYPQAAPKSEESLVLRFQKACLADGIALPKFGADGKWGSETENAAKRVISQGQSGNRVKLAQEICMAAKIGLLGGADGVFGAGTAAAVREYQKQKGLAIDGVVGISTWKAMLEVK